MCACICSTDQKLKARAAYLQKVGGAIALVERAALARKQWAVLTDAVPSRSKLQSLVQWLVREDALDFHSDDDGEVLQHTFRSLLAADIMHELDGDAVPRSSSHKFGATLSLRMAKLLKQRTDLAALIDVEKVDAVVATAKTKKNKEPSDDVDEVLGLAPLHANNRQVSINSHSRTMRSGTHTSVCACSRVPGFRAAASVLRWGARRRAQQHQ